MPKHFLKILLLLTVAFVSACAPCANGICPPAPPKPQPCADLIYSLEDLNVQVIPRGDTLRIILPVDNFFETTSTEVKPQVAPELALIAQLTQCECYALMPIRIIGYTDNVGPIPEQLHRSYWQARHIAAYLWSNGVPLSRMQVEGYGAQRSLSGNHTNIGSYDNRRVEINIP